MREAGLALLSLLLAIPSIVMGVLGIDSDVGELGESMLDTTAEIGDSVVDVLLDDVMTGVADAVSNLWWSQRQDAMETLRKRGYQTTNVGHTDNESEDVSPVMLFALNFMVKKVQRQYRQRKGGSGDLPTYDFDLSTVLHREAALTAPVTRIRSTRRRHKVQAVSDPTSEPGSVNSAAPMSGPSHRSPDSEVESPGISPAMARVLRRASRSSQVSVRGSQVSAPSTQVSVQSSRRLKTSVCEEASSKLDGLIDGLGVVDAAAVATRSELPQSLVMADAAMARVLRRGLRRASSRGAGISPTAIISPTATQKLGPTPPPLPKTPAG